jgi:hypothetical protein
MFFSISFLILIINGTPFIHEEHMFAILVLIIHEPLLRRYEDKG